MKTIPGLDLGANSVGWAVINSVIKEQAERIWIEMAGSRITPMDAAVLGDLNKGDSISQTSGRTRPRGARRLRERQLLRRERLHKMLNILGFLPNHYLEYIDFGKHPGKSLADVEPELAWVKDEQGKYTFLFQAAFDEMLTDFAIHQPSLVSGDKKIPHDWTIYYLRKRALTKMISKEELAWILLNFNQKRGCYQLRGEEEEDNAGKSVEFYALKVLTVEATDEKKGRDVQCNVHLENGWIYRRGSSVPLDREGQVKEFIITTDLNPDGAPKLDKYGGVKRPLRAPKEDDWVLIKKRTEADIANTHKTAGAYIYGTLLRKPQQKITGKLVKTVEWELYRDELSLMLQEQCAFHAELQDRALYARCVEALYPSNEARRKNITNRDFVYLLVGDILFYQRPLKAKKSLIANCPYEESKYVDWETGEIKEIPLKCIAKSYPLFQEFRLQNFLFNIRIYQKEKEINGTLRLDVDVTAELLKTEDDHVALFDWLNSRKEIKQKIFLKYPKFGLKKEISNYRWNHVEDKQYPCNETRHAILSSLEKANVCIDFLSNEKEVASWHVLYSVSDEQKIERALRTFAAKNGLDESFVEVFKKLPPFKSEYRAYSVKVIKKMLLLMRYGKYWNVSSIDDTTKEKIKRIVTGEYDERISVKVGDKVMNLSGISCFRRLPLWLACYIVYNCHSEDKEAVKWESSMNIDTYLASFKQYSLRNPIVEQVITETLHVTRDIWRQVERIDEIHIELGREMKNPADKRKRMTAQILENENASLRIKTLLAEFMNPEYEIENVRPYSSSQREILRIYEDTVLHAEDRLLEEIDAILKKFNNSKVPTKLEFLCYKLWLKQKYRSPCTGELIPLGKLFAAAYGIEHVIPQSRYLDDPFSDKVICKSVVNRLKDNQLGYEFIRNRHGQKVEAGSGKSVEVFSVDSYERFVKEQYAKSAVKMKKLLMDDTLGQFIERQLDDSRCISKVIKGLLSNIVREKNDSGEYESEAVFKNIIVCTESVTNRLKRDWGMNDVWNSIVYPRFECLNSLTDTQSFGHWENKSGKKVFQTELPLEYQKGFSKKRIDHRHHAMDAIVIACATRNHMNYLSNESASRNAKISHHDLQRLLCDKNRTDDNGNYKWVIRKPWDTFTQDAREVLSKIVVSLKQSLRIINKTTSVYRHLDATRNRVYEKQKTGDSWAIREPMHKDTVFGAVNPKKVKVVRLSIALDTPVMIVDKRVKNKVFKLLSYKYDKKRIEKYFKGNAFLWKELDLAKAAAYYFAKATTEPLVAVRKPLDSTFNEKKIKESVTDTGIRKILLNHSCTKEGKPDLTFSAEGIEEMNRSLLQLNNGKSHQSIYKVGVYEPRGNKFSVGVLGNKGTKWVEAAKGTNLFFAIYITEDGKRAYETIPLNVVIERKKQEPVPILDRNKKEDKLLFWLSPNDLAYLPAEEEREFDRINEPIDRRRIYKMVSRTGNEGHFIPANVANPMVPVIELDNNNKVQRAWTNEIIKDICIPIKVDRLGHIIEVKYRIGE